MNETDYKARLYEKMKAEQEKYRDWLLHQEPPEILEHTYEFGLPCPAFLRFLLTAPVSMIPLAILLVGEEVSLWIAPLLPDQEKPADESRFRNG